MYPYKSETEETQSQYGIMKVSQGSPSLVRPTTPSLYSSVGASPTLQKPPTPPLAFTTQFASTSHAFDSHTNSGPTTPLHTPTFNAVFYPPSGNRRDSISQLQFEDSPIKVTCRTRGRSSSPYLASLHGQSQNDTDMRSAKVFTYNDSEQSSPIQGTTPNFELINRLALATPPLYDSDTLPQPTSNTAVEAVVNSLLGLEANSGNNVYYNYQNDLANANNRLTNQYDAFQPMQSQYTQQRQCLQQQQQQSQQFKQRQVQSINTNKYDVVVKGYSSGLQQHQQLPASVVHRALHGRCKFVAFPTNLPNVRCRNSPSNIANNTINNNAQVTLMPYVNGSGSIYDNGNTMAPAFANTSTNMISLNNVNSIKSSNVNSSNIGNNSINNGNFQMNDKAAKEHALFIGQVRFQTTPAQLIWLVHRCTGACASFLESRGAGCYLLYCKSEADLQLVRTLHKRILFDIGGFWLARTAQEVDALCEHVALDAPLLSRKAHLPRDSMVVEEVKQDAVSLRHGNHHSTFSHGSRNNANHFFAMTNNNNNNNNNNNSSSCTSNNNVSMLTNLTSVVDSVPPLQNIQVVSQLYNQIPVVGIPSIPASIPHTSTSMLVSQQQQQQQQSLMQPLAFPPPYNY